MHIIGRSQIRHEISQRWQTEIWTKCLPFCKQQFESYSLLNSVKYDIIEICSMGSKRRQTRTGLGKDFVLRSNKPLHELVLNRMPHGISRHLATVNLWNVIMMQFSSVGLIFTRCSQTATTWHLKSQQDLCIPLKPCNQSEVQMVMGSKWDRRYFPTSLFYHLRLKWRIIT